MSRPTFLSLFAGIGGLDLALEYHGWRCVGRVEDDPYCDAVLAERWPKVPRWGDIRKVDWDGVVAWTGSVDLVAAGFPCQPTSQAGRRKAQKDPRWLWPEVARCLRHLRPEYVFLENTLGLLSRGIDDVLGDLAALGFDAEWDCWQAADVGAPHERDRVFVLAYANGEGQPQPGWPVGEGRGWAGDGGEPLADADSVEPERAGETGVLAGTPGSGVGQGPQWQRDGHAAGDRGADVADAAGPGRRRPDRAGEPGGRSEPARRLEPGRLGSGNGGTLADPVGAGLEVVELQPARHQRPPTQRGGHPGQGRQPQPGLGGDADGLPATLDGHRWPAPPGPHQYPWEPPRTVGKGVPFRGRRVKALGNAVVPQQGALAFAVLWRRMLEAVA